MLRYVGEIILFSLCGFTLIGCAVSSSSSLQDDRTDVSTTTEYASVVEIFLPGGSGICTGTIVGERAILTAAHCTLASGTYRVKTDKGTFSTSKVRYSGEGVVESTDDIAILVFETAIASAAQNDVIYSIANTIHTGDTIRLVGFGCNNLDTRSGAGTKRTGTNQVNTLDDYINFLSPQSGSSSRGILGPGNQAASCFGDSGGPALVASGTGFSVVGVTHAGGAVGSNLLSEYTNVATNSANRAWLRKINSSENLNIQGL